MTAAASELLGADFYARSAREVARDLIGCGLFRDGVGGTIVETEAYEQDDPACHAYIGRTKRSDVLFGPAGRAYVYLCYGVHSMFNVVTDEEGIAAAVLAIRDEVEQTTRRLPDCNRPGINRTINGPFAAPIAATAVVVVGLAKTKGLLKLCLGLGKTLSAEIFS